ncbi:MAG TPA: alpha/beta fold hydrolase, partial [Polyangiaceae bacterium]|nr:alpha/beta fold hydrolase [Polyangiaceae bacterium]
DPEFSFQLLRVLGSAASHQADVGEGLAVADRIVEGDFESWAREWTRAASRLEAAADASLAAGHRVSASDTYLRATNYYRAAEFYLHGDANDPRIKELSGKSARCFEAGLKSGERPFEFCSIPYEGTSLPGIFYSGGPGKRRTVIVQTGFDGTIDGLLPLAIAATRRGWHCLTFEGPGQGQVIRKQGLPFRPDWESVIGPVIDYLSGRAEVDAERLALIGMSFGGFLAPRAAAFERRLAACVANGGVLEFLGSRVPPALTREQFVHALKNEPERVNAVLRAQAAHSPSARWSQENGQFTFGAASPVEWLVKALDYDLTSHAAKIRCPMLVVDVEHENSFPGEARKLYDALACPKTWLHFSEEEGAGDHCQTGSPTLSQQRVFDWLDETVRA